MCGISLARHAGERLLVGWMHRAHRRSGGLFFSFYCDLPSGAAIVCTFGALLLLVSLLALFRQRPAAS